MPNNKDQTKPRIFSGIPLYIRRATCKNMHKCPLTDTRNQATGLTTAALHEATNTSNLLKVVPKLMMTARHAATVAVDRYLLPVARPQQQTHCPLLLIDTGRRTVNCFMMCTAYNADS